MVVIKTDETSKTIEPNARNKIEQIASKTVDASKIFEQNLSKTIEAGTAKYFLSCIDNLLEN